MVAAIVCREYGWTYQEYYSQPAEFIDTITLMLNAEAEESKKRDK